MRWAQEQRLSFIGQRILAGQTVNRRDLIEKFRISPPQAATDFRLFNDKHPGAMRYDATRKAYVAHKITTQQTPSDTSRWLEAARICRDTYCKIVPGKRQWHQLSEQEQRVDVVCLQAAFETYNAER